jgi:hypothetical protein
MNPTENAVATPNAAYKKWRTVWKMVDDLLGGTQTMRDAGVQYLPMHTAESATRYMSRLNRTFLYNGFKRTITSLVGKPFSEDVHVAKEIPGQVMEYLADCDLLGHDTTFFAAQLTKVGLAKGLFHFLVEYPNVKGRLTLEEKKQQNVRPYFLFVDPDDVIGWQYKVISGQYILTQLRIKQCIMRQNGEFGEVEVQQVRVYDLAPEGVLFRLFELRNDAMNQPVWMVVDGGVTTTKRIPFVTGYFGDRCGYMQAEVPLQDLMWMNIEHWQSSSEQRNILNIARIPFWVVSGYSEELDDQGAPINTIKIGSDQMIKLEDPQAKIEIVESNGNAISLGRTDLQDIEARMSIQGASLLYKKTGKGDTTATESAHDAEAEDCALASMMKELENKLSNGIRLMEEWESIPVTEGKLVTINTDFGIEPQDAADLQALYQSRIAGQITHLTYLKELQRRKVLAPSVKIEDEEKAAKLEGPVPVPQKDNTSSTMNAGPDGMTNKGGAGA